MIEKESNEYDNYFGFNSNLTEPNEHLREHNKWCVSQFLQLHKELAPNTTVSVTQKVEAQFVII